MPGTRAQIKKAVIAAIQIIGHGIYHTSQMFVPVDTGRLRRSGRVRLLKDGVYIKYGNKLMKGPKHAYYAAAQEFGVARTAFVGDQKVKVKEHTIKGFKRADGIYIPDRIIPAHTRTYHNARLVGFTPVGSSKKVYRVLTGYGPIKPKLYLTRAVERELPKLTIALRAELARMGLKE